MPQLVGEIIGDRQADERFVDVGRRHGDAVTDGGGESHADRTRPAVPLEQFRQGSGNGFRGRRMQRLDANFIAMQFPGFGVHNGRLDSGSADINANDMHSGAYFGSRFRA